jgi:ubiquinone/menaquinone biosynthesis C-methylase UbiE
MVAIDQYKNKYRATWAIGDYSKIAQGIQSIADHVVRSARIRSGERVLDIACGTGNAALAARARGAETIGLDLTPELLQLARLRATEEGVEGIIWQEGDAESLPFRDGSFDVVISSCGLMFAPDQLRVASEVARVTKRAGRIAIQAWTREGGVGRSSRLTSKYIPPMAGAPSPFDWGDPERTKALLGDWFTDFRFEYYDCPAFGDTPQEMADLFITHYGPTRRAYESLSPERAALYRDELTEFYHGYVTPADGKVRFGREYVVSLATRI